MVHPYENIGYNLSMVTEIYENFKEISPIHTHVIPITKTKISFNSSSSRTNPQLITLITSYKSSGTCEIACVENENTGSLPPNLIIIISSRTGTGQLQIISCGRLLSLIMESPTCGIRYTLSYAPSYLEIFGALFSTSLWEMSPDRGHRMTKKSSKADSGKVYKWRPQRCRKVSLWNQGWTIRGPCCPISFTIGKIWMWIWDFTRTPILSTMISNLLSLPVVSITTPINMKLSGSLGSMVLMKQVS